MAKRMSLMLLAVFLVFGGIFGWKAVGNHFMNQYFDTFQPPPVAVAAVEALEREYQPYISAVGSLAPVNGVDIANEVAGVVREIRFESGQAVKRGDLLVQLDDDTDRADLKGLEALLQLARINAQRNERLVKKKLTSQENLDVARTELRNAEALVESKRAVIEKKSIEAPFDGVLGIRKINVGQFLDVGKPIVNLQSTGKLYVDFTLPEQNLKDLGVGRHVQLGTDAWPGQTFDAVITAIEPRVEESTRSVAVRGELSSAEGRLRPGMFVLVRVLAAETQRVVTLPKTAVTYTLYGDSVFLIRENGKDEQGEPQLTVTRQAVKVGAELENSVAIAEGVQVGERVVAAGQLKLSDGARVYVDNTVKLD